MKLASEDEKSSLIAGLIAKHSDCAVSTFSLSVEHLNSSAFIFVSIGELGQKFDCSFLRSESE